MSKVDILTALKDETESCGSALPCRRSAQMETLKYAKECLSKFEEMKATEITITFNPRLSDNWNDEMLSLITKETIMKALKRVKGYQMLLIGEHSQTGLYYFHGIFQGIPNDKIATLRRRLSHELGRTEIKMIKYFSSYHVYMFKSFAEPDKIVYKPEEWKYYTSITLGFI